jgi:hypothetical protein
MQQEVEATPDEVSFRFLQSTKAFKLARNTFNLPLAILPIIKDA